MFAKEATFVVDLKTVQREILVGIFRAVLGNGQDPNIGLVEEMRVASVVPTGDGMSLEIRLVHEEFFDEPNGPTAERLEILRSAIYGDCTIHLNQLEPQEVSAS